MRKLAILAAGFLFNFHSLYAVTILVHFVDQKQKPLDKVNSKVVNLKNNDEATPAQYKKGLATFEEIPSGSYQLYATLENHRKTKSEILGISGKDLDLTIVLPEENEFEKVESAGNAAFQQQNYQEARTQYEKALAWSPWDPGMAHNLARTYVRLGDSNKARELVKITSKYEVKEPEKIEQEIVTGINFEEGRMALEKQDFMKAINLMKETLKVEPDNADAYDGLALAYGHLGNYPEALKNINEALKFRPNDATFIQIKTLLEHNAKVASQQK